jgi:hypothetical protein
MQAGPREVTKAVVRGWAHLKKVVACVLNLLKRCLLGNTQQPEGSTEQSAHRCCRLWTPLAEIFSGVHADSMQTQSPTGLWV